MNKKLLGLVVSTAALSGMVGCSYVETEDGFGVTMNGSGITINGEGFGEIAEGEYDEVYSYGVDAETLFNKMNELREALDLRISDFEASYYEIEGEQFLEGYDAIVSEGVVLRYVTLTDEEWQNLRDESSVRLLDRLEMVYDKSNPNAIRYVSEFTTVLSKIAFENLLKDDIHELSQGFSDYSFNLYQTSNLEEEDLDEELTKMLKDLGIKNLSDIAYIDFY